MRFVDSKQLAINGLAALWLAASTVLWGVNAGAAEESGWIEQMQAQEQALAELESLNGPFDSSLIEPLQAMIRLLEEQSEYERIAELQERQLALMRTNLGLDSPELIPLLKEMALNRIASGDAEEVTDHLQLIRHLSASESDPESMLRVIGTLAFWHLSSDVGVSTGERVENFFAARELVDELENAAEEIYGEDDPAMVPWLYLAAMNSYQLVGMLNSEHGASGRTIRELVRHDGATRLRTSARGFSFNPTWSTTITPVIEDGQLVGELYLREGMAKIADMRDIFEETGNLEGQAMATIYRSDFQLLMGRGTAFSQYRDAQDLLREAGIPADRIQLFFGRPQLLPVSRFYPVLEEAIAHQEAELASWRPDQEDVTYVPPYKAWDESVPTVREPVSDHAFWETGTSYHQVDLEFRISSRGGVSGVDILSAEPDDRRSRRIARQAARDLHFRPVMQDGRGQRLRDVRMRFLLPRRD